MLRDVAITHAQSRIAYMPVLTEIFEIGHRKKLFTSPVDSTNVCLEQEKQITGKTNNRKTRNYYIRKADYM